MKKYIKPAIEEHAMGATMPLMISDMGGSVGGDRQGTSGMKDKGDDEDDNGFSAGW